MYYIQRLDLKNNVQAANIAASLNWIDNKVEKGYLILREDTLYVFKMANKYKMFIVDNAEIGYIGDIVINEDSIAYDTHDERIKKHGNVITYEHKVIFQLETIELEESSELNDYDYYLNYSCLDSGIFGYRENFPCNVNIINGRKVVIGDWLTDPVKLEYFDDNYKAYYECCGKSLLDGQYYYQKLDDPDYTGSYKTVHNNPSALVKHGNVMVTKKQVNENIYRGQDLFDSWDFRKPSQEILAVLNQEMEVFEEVKRIYDTIKSFEAGKDLTLIKG